MSASPDLAERFAALAPWRTRFEVERAVYGGELDYTGDRRWRIEHAQVVDPADIARFGQHGIVASMQPVHQTSDRLMAEARLGPDRLAGAYAWRSLHAAGAPLAFGSDAPVEAPDPFAGMAVAIHCAAGLGRTGTVLAAYFVAKGLSAREAVERVRQLRPGSVETVEQERAIERYAARAGRRASE